MSYPFDPQRLEGLAITLLRTMSASQIEFWIETEYVPEASGTMRAAAQAALRDAIQAERKRRSEQI